MNLDTFKYDLPVELIARRPIYPKHCSRMMRIDMKSPIDFFQDYHFYDLVSFVKSNDVIVINDTKVLHSVLSGHRKNGALIEIKMVSRKKIDEWDCLIEGRKQVEINDLLTFGKHKELCGRVIKRNWCNTGWIIKFQSNNDKSVEENVKNLGKLFLPLHLPPTLDHEDDYQTTYAKIEGSIQPPTAGLHFTPEMLQRLKKKGVKIVSITQHVGRLDRRLAEDNIEKHEMYEEYYTISQESASKINEIKESGGRLFAIGTTVTRTLETAANDNGTINPGSGWTKLYIYPGYKFKAVDCLITNFQSPAITTIILACAFGGIERTMNAYNEAIKRKYHLLEFGDCIFFDKEI